MCIINVAGSIQYKPSSSRAGKLINHDDELCCYTSKLQGSNVNVV